MDVYDWYKNWPAWLRWVLFIPISFLLACLVNLVNWLVAEKLLFFFENLYSLLSPIVIACVLLVSLYALAPSHKMVFPVIFTVLFGVTAGISGLLVAVTQDYLFLFLGWIAALPAAIITLVICLRYNKTESTQTDN